MANTTRTKSTTTGDAVVVDGTPSAGDTVTPETGVVVSNDDVSGEVSETAVTAPGVVTTDPFPTIPGDEPPGVVVDARQAALDALMRPPVTTTSDLAPPPAPRRLPPLSGTETVLHEDGNRYLVLAAVYPRVVGDYRARARAGDVVVARDDDRTRADLAAGYLLPLD